MSARTKRARLVAPPDDAPTDDNDTTAPPPPADTVTTDQTATSLDSTAPQLRLALQRAAAADDVAALRCAVRCVKNAVIGNVRKKQRCVAEAVPDLLVGLLSSAHAAADASLLCECSAALGSFAVDRQCAAGLVHSAAPAMFAHLQRVSALADGAAAAGALCRALRVVVSAAGNSLFERAKQLVELHVDTLARLIDAGTLPSAGRLRRETAANAALLLARSLTPSHEIVVLTAPVLVDESPDVADATSAARRAPPAEQESSDDDDDDGGDLDELTHLPMATDEVDDDDDDDRCKVNGVQDNARVAASAHICEIDVDGGASGVATTATSGVVGTQACDCDGCAAAFTAGLRQTIVRSGMCASLTRLALSGDNVCRVAALESLAVVSRGCGDRHALRSLITVRATAAAAHAQDLRSLIAGALYDRQLSDEARINAIMCFVNIINPLEVSHINSKQLLVALLVQLLRERPVQAHAAQAPEDELLQQLLVIERLVAALASLTHDDAAVQRSAVEAQVLPVLGALCGSVGALVQRSGVRGGRDRRFSSPDLRLGTAVSAVVRATLLALAALCATLEDTRRVVASDQRALMLLGKALCDDAAPVRAAAAALARSMSRSVRALRTAMADTTISLPLIALLSDPCLKVQRIATAALSNTLLEFSPMKQAAIGGGAVPLLASRFKDAQADAALRLTSAWALRNLLFEAPIGVKRLVVCCLSLADLCGVLRGADAELREQSLGLLRNAMHADVNALFGVALAAEPAAAAAATTAARGAAPPSTTTISVAAAATAKWAVDDCRQLMETLAQLLRSREMNARANRHALYVICNAAAGGEPLKMAVVDSGVLLDVVAALEQPDTKVGEAALWCLINLTWPSDAGTAQRVALLRALGCVEKLGALTLHEDQGVARRAVALLSALV